ncbi:MAG: PAS domain-containing sensor histidine kinase [Deltaproteobacteria bacterium]|nr:PAS domain-containing sensor histidine kinase [Deltaproteobacteria bacterium]
MANDNLMEQSVAMIRNTSEDLLQLVHKLRAHQIELELENNVLRRMIGDIDLSNQAMFQQELIQELASLRQRIAELEQSESKCKRVADLLRKSEETLGLITDNMSDMIRLIDLQGNNLYVSPSHFTVLGYKPEERVGKSTFDIVHPEDIENVLKVFFDGIAKKRTAKVECRAKHAKGHYIWIETVGDFLRNDKGEVTAVIITSRDITERKRLEEELNRHREHLTEMVRERTAELQTTNERLRQEIVEHKRTEEALKTSKEKHRTLFMGSRDAIMTLAPPAWRFTTGNPATVEMFEVGDEAAFIELGPWELSPEFQPDGRPSSEKAAEMIQAAMAQGSHFFEWTHRRLGGESFPATVLLTRTEIGGEALLQAMVRDITDQKRAEEDIRALNVELQDRLQELTGAQTLEEAAKRAKTEFLANISHEFTTPLNIIIGFSQVLLGKNFGDLNERQQGYAENILNSGERLHDTLKNIVSFVRMDVSNPEMDWEDFRLKDVIALSLSVFRKVAADRHLTLTLDMEKEADRPIRADRGKLVQVFQNLLSNAVKFTREGGQITIRVRYRQGSEASGKDDLMEVTVEDTGISIKEEDLPRLFRILDQLEAPLTKEFAGVGMGLVLTRKLIEAHGGAIRAESDHGKGSRFIFTLPVSGGPG